MIVSAKPFTVPCEAAEMTLAGLFMYREEQAGDCSAKAFFKDFGAGRADFDGCTGAYQMRIVYPDGREVYFADNAGLQAWFICGAKFYHSFAEALPEKRTPNYDAITQGLFLTYHRIHGTATIVNEVSRTERSKYYVVENGTVTEMDKGLTPVDQIPLSGNPLEEQMRRVAKAVSGGGAVGCSITAGTDSRMILANMMYDGMDPRLLITGPETHIDVVVARQIAQRLNKELLHVSDDPDEEDWLEKAISASGGMLGVCDSYRLHKKARRLQQEGIALELGGLGGEFYKNSFINLDYPFYGGAPRWNFFMKIKSAIAAIPRSALGTQLQERAAEFSDRELAHLRAYPGETKAHAYLSAYWDILVENKPYANAVNYPYQVMYPPMLERKVVALAYHLNPREMNGFPIHREQVTRLCPEIKDIKTDHGLTLDSEKRREETARQIAGWYKSGLKLALFRKRANTRIDACFAQGLSSPQFSAALEHCKELGLLAPDAKDLPIGMADYMFALGMYL